MKFFNRKVTVIPLTHFLLVSAGFWSPAHAGICTIWGRVVSDVTASVRRISPTSFKVTLTAPSTGQSAGSDYKLRILSGNKVIREAGFAVEAPAIQAPTQPTRRPAPAPGAIRR